MLPDESRPSLTFGLGELVAAGSFALVLAVGLFDGGYFPTAWGWVVLGVVWAACLALVLRDRIALGRLEVVTLGTLALFVAWVAASIAWSNDRSLSMLEVERDLIYVVVAAAGVLLVRGRSVPHLLGGILAAIAALALYALSTRLFPDRGEDLDAIVVDQLSRPIGYANGLGILCVMGVFLALGFAARGDHPGTRALGGALVPVLLVTLYFTYSRGSWVALFAALSAMLLVDTRRFQLLAVTAALAPWSALAVWASSREDALTSLNAASGTVRDAGRQLAVLVIALALASAAASLAVPFAERRLVVGRRARLALAAALVLVALGAISAVVVHAGGPADLARRGYGSFRAAPPSSPQPENDLNARLFKLGSTYRSEQWSAAWHDYRAHPWLGSGAGTFERWWLRHRTVDLDVRDAHSLYVETLAELGWIGLGALAVALGTPVVAAVRGRRRRLVAPAFAAYVAYLLHAGVDWDWELPAVTLTAVLCGVALLVSVRDADARRVGLNLNARVAAGAVLLAIAAFSAFALVGNRALASAVVSVDTADFQAGRRHARTALRWQPWSGRAWQELGNAQLGLGDRRAARSSLLTATRKSPEDWSVWFDLGTSSRGAARRDAYERAAVLNPLDRNVRLARAGGEEK